MSNNSSDDDKKCDVTRRDFLRKASVVGLAGFAGGHALNAVAGGNSARVITAPDQPNPPVIKQPFPVPGNDERSIVQYPEKRPLIRVTSVPPQLETPMHMLNEGPLTANSAFFVRYHNSEIPLNIDPVTFTVDVKLHSGSAPYDPLTSTPATLFSSTLADLRSRFKEVSTVAVNQCSGNSRGFEDPRMPGGQLGNGTVGNARWTGVRLKDLLEMAGISASIKQVIFKGLDESDGEPPDFVKSLPRARAMDGEVLLAYGMNGEELPMLNGYPLKLIVPGWFGTYWVKHVNEIILSESDDLSKMFYMGSAYRIPDNGTGYIPKGAVWNGPWKPITSLRVRSFITSHMNGAKVQSRREVKVKGFAFDGGSGIKSVLFSVDGGAAWRKTELGENLGKYSFREWSAKFYPPANGVYTLQVKAIANSGETQPTDPNLNWNPNGYMRNVVETVRVTAVSSLGVEMPS